MAGTSSKNTTTTAADTKAAPADLTVDANTERSAGQTDVAYEDRTVDDLKDDAKSRDLPQTGSKAELVARLTQDDADKRAAETAKNNPMLGDDRKVNVDGALQFTADVRKVVDEVSERLDAEVGKHVTDMQSTVDDPQSGRLLPGAHRLQQAVDQAQQALRTVASTAAQLGQDVTA